MLVSQSEIGRENHIYILVLINHSIPTLSALLGEKSGFFLLTQRRILPEYDHSMDICIYNIYDTIYMLYATII